MKAITAKTKNVMAAFDAYQIVEQAAQEGSPAVCIFSGQSGLGKTTAGAFLFDKLFGKQFNKLTTSIYKIDGTWATPNIQFDRMQDNTQGLGVTLPEPCETDCVEIELPEGLIQKSIE